MKTTKHFIISLIILVLTIPATAQDNLNSISHNELKENIQLQTDRSLFINGEKIWFAADYFINGRHPEVQISKVLYLELLNDQNKPIAQKKYKIAEGKANGYIEIPEQAYTGNYIIRAYTKYQRNFGPGAFSYHPLTIVNPDFPPASVSSDDKETIEIIPEGGKLLADIESETAIILNDSIAHLADSIHLLDQNGNVLNPLAANSNGLLKCKISPSASNNYRLRIVLQNNDTILENFPPVKSNSLYIKTTQSQNEVIYSIHNKSKQPIDNNHTLQVYSSNYRQIKERAVTLDPGNNEIALYKNNLPKGLLYFVLKDSKENIKRINTHYNIPQKNNHIDISLNKHEFSKREQISFTANLTSGRNSKPIKTSVSVVRKGTNLNNNNLLPRHIFLNPVLLQNYLVNHMALNQKMMEQIKACLIHYDERINNADFYSNFSGNSNNSMKFFPEYKDGTLSGIMQKNTGEPIKDENVYLSVLFNNPSFHISETDENGRFRFTLKDIEGMKDIYLCPAPTFKNKNQKILVNRLFSNANSEFIKAPVSIGSEHKSLIEEMMISHQLSNSNKKPTVQIPDTSKGLSIKTVDMKSVYSADYIALKETETLINEIVPKVFVFKKRDNYSIRISQGNSTNMLPGEPLVLVDNVPVFDANKIMEIHPEQITKIDVIADPYMIGNNTMNGIVMITTSTNNFANINFPPGSSFLQYKGYAENSDFETPDYSNLSTKSNPSPDFRTTLYWNPDFNVSREGSSTSFFTSDRKGEYEIIVKGFSDDGELYYGKKTINVR